MVIVEGTVEEIIYCNEVNGYTVCDIKTDKDILTAVGYMPFISKGETLKLTGSWVTHPDYGDQFKIDTYEKLMPNTPDAIEKYLASGVIKGIGPVTAAKIVEHFGEETLEVLRFRPHILSEIRGISYDKAVKIGQAFQEQQELTDVVLFLQDFGISPAYCTKIYKALGDRTIEEIKHNPYKLADEVFGIGFKKADAIAMNLGIDRSSAYRVCSGIKYVLSQGAAAGNTYLPEDKLIDYTVQLLEIGPENIRDSLISLNFDKDIVVEIIEDGRRVYLSPFYYAESGVARKLAELSELVPNEDTSCMDDVFEELRQQEGLELAQLQKDAVREALINGTMVVTGGPGTGKTTIIKSIIKTLERQGLEVALAAPTGRAAKRMTEATGYEARTLHRLLEIGYAGDDKELLFQRTDENPIDADVIIIDEMSMVDILLMNHLLNAISPGTRLVMVGDVNQLPSVGAGNVLKDIISSGIIKTVKLTEIFRQAEESMIIVNAHRINRGEYPYLNVKEKDFFFMPRENSDSLVSTIVSLCSKRLPATYGFDPIRHIQVLTPTKKGPGGVHNLNRELQKALNPLTAGKREKVWKDFTFREGDRVMQIKNNYNLRWEKTGNTPCEGVGVFNGDTGIISNIDDDAGRLSVIFEDDRLVEYDYALLDELEPAFAITIHKSQGSEFPAVIMPVCPGPPVLLTRNLLYTAVTRAKELVILVGWERILGEMINNEKEASRYSGLCDKLERRETAF